MPDLIFSDLRGGRNGIDPPLALPENQCADALNVDWFLGRLGRKRGGAEAIGLDGDTAFTGSIMSMFRHNGGGDGLHSELWAIDNANPPVMKRTGSYAFWVESPFDDPIIATPQHVAATSFNGKFFTAYDSGVNRLHVHDVLLNKTRRVGLAAPGIPTISDEGSGAYDAVKRYYRIRVIAAEGDVIKRRSEPSPVVDFTPSGSGAGVTITRGTVPGEGETHWEIDVSLDGDIWFKLNAYEYTVAQGGIGPNMALGIADPSEDDETFPGSATVAADYLDLDIAEGIGSFTLPPAARFIVTDGNRLLMAGSYEDGPTSRVWFTPVLGSADMGDDERIIITDTISGYVDLNEKDGGEITGMAYASYGIVYVFKLQQVWKLTPTGNAASPYIPKKISDTTGCIYHKTIVSMEDAAGSPRIGFLSLRGAYSIGIEGGLTYIGRDVEDIWFGVNNYPTKVNVNADTMIAHGVYYADRKQAWWYLAVDDEDSPSIKIVLDTRHLIRQDQYGMRGGWSRHTGASCRVVCSAMAPEFVGTVDASRRLVPYVGTRGPE